MQIDALFNRARYCRAMQNASAYVQGENHVSKFIAFLKDESGATAIEYALIASGIALVIITAVKGIGTRLNTTFSSISTQLK